MTDAALDISANKHHGRVDGTKTLSISLLTLFFLCRPSLCHLSLVLFHSQMSHVFLVFFSIYQQDIGLSFPLSLCFLSPLRRLTQSLLRVRKQTQIILGVLLACDRGLASRFKWEHMEIIITANWHMRERASPPGKRNERRTNSRLTQLAASPKEKNNLKREPPESGYYPY